MVGQRLRSYSGRRFSALPVGLGLGLGRIGGAVLCAECLRGKGATIGELPLHVTERDRRSIAQHHEALDEILQLTHITGPALDAQTMQSLRTQAHVWLAVGAPKTAAKRMRQKLDIFTASPE